MRAWYMAPEDLRVPRTGEVIEVGSTVRIVGPLVMCQRGLHASRSPLDAISYRSAGCLTLVELGGEIIEWDDKLCATERTTVAVLTRAQTDRVLREAACRFAEMAIGWSGVEPDQRSVDAIDCARRFARGEATADELAVARAAAWAAARAAAGAAEALARDAAWAAEALASDAAWAASDAAGAAAWAAEGDAARAAEALARDAAWAAEALARDAAWAASDAAGAAAWAAEAAASDATNNTTEALARDAAWAAAWDAAWAAARDATKTATNNTTKNTTKDAAWAAAWAAAGDVLERLALEAMGKETRA